MTGQRAKARHHIGSHTWRADAIGVLGVTDDADDPVFGQRAACPVPPTGCLEPHMRNIVMDVNRIDQCDQYVAIKQMGAQRDSSRNALTTSSVTGPALAVTGISGTPPRDFAEAGSGRNDWLASSDTTSPRGFFARSQDLWLRLKRRHRWRGWCA